MIMKKCCGVHALRIAVGITMLVLLLAGSANAANLTVCPSGCEYSSIQKAIKASSNGDTILVKSGKYFENVNVTKQLTLRGIGNPVVDAGGSGSAITLFANGITLEGFTATGSGSYSKAGIKVTSSNNTLSGNNASNNGNGISLSYSNNNMLNSNIASNNGHGILLSSSSNNTLTGNIASHNQGRGISLSSSSNNTLSGNKVYSNQGDDDDYGAGISLESSSNNIISNNNARSNDGDGGIYLYESSNNNTLSGNNANSNNVGGILLSSSSNNTLSGNNASKNKWGGISLESSSKNVLINNIMKGNTYNFDIYGDVDSDFDNHIDTDNLVDGRPIYYIIKASDTTYDSSSNAGTFYCISCVNVTIKNLNLNKNGKGIYFWNTSQSRIQNVSASNNVNGIYLISSRKNTLSGNTVNSNLFNGILLESSRKNTLSGNIVSNSPWNGISLSDSSNNTLSGNNASNNGNEYGGAGISLSSSSKNVLINNIMKGNNYNFGLEGSSDSYFDNQIDTTNLVDGKPIFFIKGAKDIVYDSITNAGTFYCISCVNVTLKNLDLKSNRNGIYFWNTTRSTIQNVNASNNYDAGISLSSSSNNTMIGNIASGNIGGYYGYGGGIYLYESSNNNTLSGNNASNNGGTGISLDFSSNNKIFNNIFNNTNNINNNGNNIWSINKTSGINIIGGPILGGNFWATPEGTGFSQTCKDMNNNGICEKRYILDKNNIDYLPISMNFTNDKIPPKSVSKLKNVSYSSYYINWTWTDPKNLDFKKVMVFMDNKFKKNVSKGKMYFNATNFTANTSHTISTWTVDMNGNINKTWTNSSAWTAN